MKAGVPLASVAASTIYPDLQQHYGADPVRIWGSPTGDKGRKRSVWKKIDPPAVAFFYSQGRFSASARIWVKEPLSSDGETGNPTLAEAIWSDPCFEHIVYLDQVQVVSSPSIASKQRLFAASARSACSPIPMAARAR